MDKSCSPLPAQSRHSFWAAILIPILLGVYFRLWNITHQIMGGDEIHAVISVLNKPLNKLLFEYQTNNICKPLVGFYHLYLEWAGSLSEMVIRGPVLLLGLVSLFVLPWIIRKYIGVKPAICFAWLLAISPMMVSYTKISRSYMPIMLFGFLSLIFFYLWWVKYSKHHLLYGILYLAFASLTVFFHLLMAPFVFSPILAGFFDALLNRKGDWRRSFLELLVCFVCLMFLVSTFILPGLDSLIRLTEKCAQSHIRVETILATAQLQGGVKSNLLNAVFWFVSLMGFIGMFRRFKLLSMILTLPMLLQFATILFLSPKASHLSYVFNRYVVIGLPCVLLFCAYFMSAPFDHPHKQNTKLVMTFNVLFILALLFMGPLLAPQYQNSSFATHDDYVDFTQKRCLMKIEDTPPFYLNLNDNEGVLEYPWLWSWMNCQLLYAYQDIHGQRVHVAPFSNSIIDPRLDFENMKPPSPEHLLKSRAKFLAIHSDISNELKRLEGERKIWMGRERAKSARHKARKLIKLLKEQWKVPDYEDKDMVVWDMNKIRETRKRSNQ